MSAFRKILIANRGEIACRVIRTARARGYSTVAVASEADRDALHARLACETVVIGPAPAAQSYLDAERILEAARRTGADAVHPGYGFLSENAAFAQACLDAGLMFIGPPPEAIRVMGDKALAKRRMIEAGVPCIPGYQGEDAGDARLLEEGKRIGFPLMVKAAAGGGGRGIRLVAQAAELPAALASARSEAQSGFGDGTLLLERAIEGARHVEIQVFGDRFGHLVHLGERDCSVQRRRQKVIEEAPSPALDAGLRARMGAVAVEAARAVGYVGAGTVEFLLDREGGFYFLEMNTRLQVEHPVTELVTGLDLVALQLEVAAGKPLPFGQADVSLNGWAVEARLYAEDPAQGFLPQTGRLSVWRPAAGEGVRIDHGLSPGAEITPFYDPMIAKVIAWGGDRETARRRLIEALRDTAALGVGTNKAFLIRTLEAEAFAAGEADTGFLGRTYPDGFPSPAPDADIRALAAALLSEGAGAGWRSNAWLTHPVVLEAGGEQHRLAVRREGLAWRVGDQRLEILARSDDRVTWRADGHERSAVFAIADGVLHLDLGDAVHVVSDITFAPPKSTQATSDGRVRAPMSGLVCAVHIAPGDPVRRGQLLIVLEAMKMEHQILSPRDGVALSVAAGPGAQVSARDLLAEIGE